MKLNIQTKTEKTNFVGLLVIGNFLAATICFLLLLMQFIYFPQYFGITWTFVLALNIGVAYFNLRYFRTQYRVKHLWEWLKNHQ